MGFTKPSAAPAAATNPIPVTTYTDTQETTRDYNSRNSRRRGLLSTILNANADPARQQQQQENNTTLG
ncbi:MAG: hypothetical protein Q4F30_06445 [Akkermansia sp.]|nr:hypothetical protein [Akkermansia sp.]